MIVLDTNVISEGFRKKPNPAVRVWLDHVDMSELFLCAPVVAELRYGVERLPASRRRSELDTLISNAEDELFANRILPFDRESAHELGRIVAKRAGMGRPILPMDALIAAVASANGMAIATRDVDDFAGLGLELINPFETAVDR
jgi:predicted nucleic acid-binding protein